MADPQIQPEIYAVIGAALFGALLAQFLSFHRRKRQDFEELKSILRLITLLDEDEIEVKIESENSFLWFLREELFQSYKRNILYLGDSEVGVLNIIRAFPSPDSNNPSGYLDSRSFKRDAEEAYEALERVNPFRMIWLTLLGFLGMSQEKLGDLIDELLMEGEAGQLTVDQLAIEGESLSTGPIGSSFGVFVPMSRLLKIGIVWALCVILIIAAAVGIYLAGSFNQTIELALYGAIIAVSVGFFIVFSIITFMGNPVTSATPDDD